MAIRDPDVTNSLIEDAEDYIRKNQILELFEDLCTLLTYEQPVEVKQFLIQELENRKRKGPAGHTIFTDIELKNVFTLFDLAEKRQLTRDQCREALKTIASSECQNEKVSQLEIGDTVDERDFLGLCREVLK